MLKVYIPILFLLIPLLGSSQSVDLNQLVSFEFKAERLESVLSKISRQYTIPFAYSKNFIPIDQRINITIVNIPLQLALDSLFVPTQIVYAVIGQSIVLRIDRSKSISTSSKSIKEIAPVPISIPNPDPNLTLLPNRHPNLAPTRTLMRTLTLTVTLTVVLNLYCLLTLLTPAMAHIDCDEFKPSHLPTATKRPLTHGSRKLPSR